MAKRSNQREAGKEGGEEMKTAALYCRVSTDNQEAEGTSLDSQLKACQDKAQALGYEISKDYTIRETYSGLSLDRPKLNQLREWVRDKEVDVVIAYTLDRLSRDPVHFIILQEELERAGITLIMVTEDVDSSDMGRLITYIKGFAAKLEAEKIKERTRRGRRARIASGKLANGRASSLYGYNYIPGRGENEGIRQVNECQTKVVREIFCWYTEEGLPLDRVIYRLLDSHVESPTGNKIWARATVYKMLTNKAYCGLPHTPAIIDHEMFNKATVRLRRNRELAARNVKHDYLLRGYLFCQHCGKRYQGALKRYNTNGGVKEYLYYRCSSSFRINANPCCNHSWKADALESMVWKEIEKGLSDPRVILAGLEAFREEVAKADTYQQQLVEIEDRLNDLDKDQTKLLQWALKGFPESQIVRENEQLNQERKRLEGRKEGIIARIESVSQAQIDAEGILEAVNILKTNLSDLSFESKRQTLEALRIRIMLGRDAISIEGILPVSYGVVSSTPSNRNGERMPSISACQLTQPGQSMPLGCGLPHLGQSGGIIRGSE